jgi:hypothetical protein
MTNLRRIFSAAADERTFASTGDSHYSNIAVIGTMLVSTFKFELQ